MNEEKNLKWFKFYRKCSVKAQSSGNVSTRTVQSETMLSALSFQRQEKKPEKMQIKGITWMKIVYMWANTYISCLCQYNWDHVLYSQLKHCNQYLFAKRFHYYINFLLNGEGVRFNSAQRFCSQCVCVCGYG